MNLTQAVERTRLDRLDDDGTRWTDEMVVRALQYALSDVISEYVDAQGDALRRVSGELTSTAAGVLDLSSLNIAKLHGISVKYGNRYYQVHAAKPRDRVYDDQAVRTFVAEYSLMPVLGTATFDADGDFATGNTNPLVSTDGTTQVTTWDALEDLICIRAAKDLAVKDADPTVIKVLADLERDRLANVMKRDPVNRASRFPGAAGVLTRLLRHYWNPADETVQIHRTAAV